MIATVDMDSAHVLVRLARLDESGTHQPKFLAAFYRLAHVVRKCAVVISLLSVAIVSGQLEASVSQRSVSTPAAVSDSCDIEVMLGTPGHFTPVTIRPPIRTNLMWSRYWDLVHTLEGYRRTGVPLVAVEGNVLGLVGATDDPGIYYLIPKLTTLTGWSLDHSIDVFFAAVLMLGLVFGIVGFALYFHLLISRVIAILAVVALAVVAYRLGDVYMAQFTTAAVVVPWTLYFSRRASNAWSLLGAALSGTLIGAADYVRSLSGTASLVFALIICLFGMGLSARRKVLVAACLLGGIAVPTVIFHSVIAQRDAFMVKWCPKYAGVSGRHVFWHPVYLGFGYLQNDYNIRWNDMVGYDRVQALAPGTPYGSTQYEHILRSEVFSLVRHHPWFAFTTLASKAGVVLCFVLMFANVGIPAALLWPKPWPVELAFWAAISLSALPGILVMPLASYLVGLMSFATFYGVVSIGFAIESRQRFKARREPNVDLPLRHLGRLSNLRMFCMIAT